MNLDFPHTLSCPVWRGADPDDCGRDTEGDAAASRRSGRRRPDAGCRPPWRAQHVEMGRLWSAAGVTRRPDRLALTGVLLDRAAPATSNELTVGQADLVLAQLRELDTAGRLREWAAETLAGRAAG